MAIKRRPYHNQRGHQEGEDLTFIPPSAPIMDPSGLPPIAPPDKNASGSGTERFFEPNIFLKQGNLVFPETIYKIPFYSDEALAWFAQHRSVAVIKELYAEWNFGFSGVAQTLLLGTPPLAIDIINLDDAAELHVTFDGNEPEFPSPVTQTAIDPSALQQGNGAISLLPQTSKFLPGLYLKLIPFQTLTAGSQMVVPVKIRANLDLTQYRMTLFFDREPALFR
ncbi:hypothetical protein L0244_28675 [bacterium]|nr:hypothetical protein [bacterium]